MFQEKLASLPLSNLTMLTPALISDISSDSIMTFTNESLVVKKHNTYKDLHSERFLSKQSQSVWFLTDKSFENVV